MPTTRAVSDLCPNVSLQVLGFVDQLTAQGTWAEYVRVPYWHVARKPDYLSHEEAASLPFSITGATNLLKLFAHGMCNFWKGRF